MKKDEFKEFVKKNPKLISYVKNNEMTWQKFYEMYDLYGEDNDIWKGYIELKKIDNIDSSSNIPTPGLMGLSFGQIINWLKNVDLDGLQEGIGNVQRVLGVVQDFSNKSNKEDEKSSYKPRPIYKHFED